MGKTVDIIASGTEFMDDCGVTRTGIKGVRFNGRTVEKLHESGSWSDAARFNANIKELIWLPNGSVKAILEDGRCEYATDLVPTPNKYNRIRYELPDNNVSSNSQSTRNTSRESKDGNMFVSILLWPIKMVLKGVWALVKFVFWTLLLGSIFEKEK